MPKTKSPPVNLDKYLEGRKHKYMNYQQAARHYGLPYWGFVKVAKEAKATWKLRKTAIVDTVVFDRYLEEHCAVTEDEDVIYETEEMDMPKVIINQRHRRNVRPKALPMYAVNIMDSILLITVLDM